MLRLHILGWFLVLCVVIPQWAHGSVPAITAAQVQGITDSARAKVLAHLGRGELVEALQAYEVATGLKAPLWLTGFKAAFDASKQVPGACQGVARSIHTVFTRLGGKPEYVKLTAQVADKQAYVEIVFRLANGKDAHVSQAGLHGLVRMNDRAYDAYTGASGLPWAEYMSRLGARAPIIEKVVELP
ncbi:hypothetical protein POL68_39650 [Stigmatella sp. ncwal1]|uniref:Lipoprotein n=1 Tax=Stigmatella ashevillensis TaxID=2995309 RepID=A0ABT5DQI6_9BACT|nr:hypothetical protein [Stigmatella ashevillena]MDC0714631.1 hypothetical protein [Stigmatella ashevillena]